MLTMVLFLPWLNITSLTFLGENDTDNALKGSGVGLSPLKEDRTPGLVGVNLSELDPPILISPSLIP